MTSDVNVTASTVVAIQGNPVSSSAPSTNQVLEWDGSQWISSTIVDASVSSSAAIAGSKISPNFGSQALTAGTSALGTTTSANSIIGSLAYTTKTFSTTGTIDTTTNDNIIFADTSGAAFTLTLPTPTNGRSFLIKDKKQSFGTNNLTLARHGTEKIDGTAASLVLSINNQQIIIESDGTDWYTSNFSGLPTGSASGDLSGTYPNPTVAKLQGRSVVSTAPSDGQVLTWVNANSDWEPKTPTGPSLPYAWTTTTGGSTSSGTFSDLLSTTITTTATGVINAIGCVVFTGNNFSSPTMGIRIVINGSNGPEIQHFGNSSLNSAVTCNFISGSLNAGTYTVKIQWRVVNGTLVNGINASLSAFSLPQ